MRASTVDHGGRCMPTAPRCATYVRTAVATATAEKPGLTGPDAQRDMCVAYLRSELHGRWMASFEDLGFSGFGLGRPALQRLLVDIDAGVIDVVVVLGVDRLSRSSRERAELLTRFQRAGVSLVVAGRLPAAANTAAAVLAAREGTSP